MDRSTLGRRFRPSYIQDCRVLRPAGTLEGLACNISLSGLHILIDPVLSVGEHVRVRFPLPGRRSCIEVEVEVLWQNLDPPGYGVRFLGLPSEDLHSIEDLVRSQRHDRPPALALRQPSSGVYRVPYVHRCRLQRKGAGLSATVCNVSTLGVYVATRAALRAGEAVELTFPLPRDAVGIAISTTVAWANADAARKLDVLPRGFGLRFDALSAADLRRIEALVADLRDVPRILLVEDNPGDVDLVRMALDPAAWSLTHTGAMATALAAMSGNAVDAVLLDLGLPDARGVEAVRRIGTEFANVPIVVLTGLDDEVVSLQAVQEGAQDYLVKGELNEKSLAHALSYAIERQRAETALAHLAAIVESSNEAVLRCTPDGTVASWNRGAERIFGFASADALGQVFSELVAEEHRSAAQAVFEKLGRGTGTAPFEVPFVRKDGRRIHVSLTISPIRDHALRVVGASVVAWDVTRRKELEAEVVALSLHDELTGLHNRRGFIQLAEQQMKIAKRHGRPMILLYVDVDRLKTINDQFGHAEGDAALTATAALLKQTFRETSVIGRLGGDEFVALIVDAAPSSARTLVKRLERNVAAWNATSKRPYDLSMSVGTAVAYPRRPASLETLWDKADAAMYRAKPATVDGRPARGRRRAARAG